MPQQPQERRFKLSNGKPVKFPHDWSDDQVADVLSQMEADVTASSSARPADFRPARIEGRGTGAQNLATREQVQAAAKYTPMIASGLAALLSEGVSIPAQAAIQGLIGGIGGGAQSAAAGNSAGDVVKDTTIGTGTGLLSGYVGGKIGDWGQALSKMGKVTPINVGGDEIIESQLPDAIGRGFGAVSRPGMRFDATTGQMSIPVKTAVTKTPEWRKELLTPELEKAREWLKNPATNIGGPSRLAGLAVSAPSATRAAGGLLSSGVAPGIPLSMQALLAAIQEGQRKR